MSQRVTMQTGSALLTVLLIMSSLCILCFTIWRTVTLSFDIALKKQEYEYHHQRARGALEQGLSLCKNQFATMQSYLKLHKQVIIKLPSLVKNNTDYCQMKLQCITDDAIYIETKSYKGKKPLCALSCNLVRAVDIEKDNEAPSYYYAVTTWKKNGSLIHG